MDFVCIGVPYYIGERLPERTEIETIKHSGIAAEIGAEWVDIVPQFAADESPVTSVNRALAAVVQSHPGKVPLVFASCCCSALGALKGLEARKPAVLWYDAHGDFNTPQTTPSGFLGGMPVAWLVGRGDEQYMRGIDLAPMAEDDIVIADARDLDPEEGVALRASRIRHVPDVDDLLRVSLPDRPLYIHMDVDVIDPDDMPGLGYPAPGGPSTEEVSATLARVVADGQLAGVLFSLWNDSLTDVDRALQNVLRLVRTIVGNA